MTRHSKISIGDSDIFVLEDGGTEFDNEVFPAVDPDRIDSILSDNGASAIETSFNAFLVRQGDANVLVDCGAADVFGDAAGHIHDVLKDIGVTASDISHLVLTHLHPDHIAGAIDGDGNVVFGDAEVFIPENEHAYWVDDSNFANAEGMAADWRGVALSVLDAYKDRTTLVAANADLAGGVTLVDMPGHTPGHVGFRVDSGSDSFINICDALHAQVLQFADPTICAAFDVDPEGAIQTRKKVLDMIAADRLPFSGGHILGAGIHHLERSGSGYRLA